MNPMLRKGCGVPSLASHSSFLGTRFPAGLWSVSSSPLDSFVLPDTHGPLVFWNEKLNPGSFNLCYDKDNFSSHPSCALHVFSFFFNFCRNGFFPSKTAGLLVCFILSLVSSFGPWLIQGHDPGCSFDEHEAAPWTIPEGNCISDNQSLVSHSPPLFFRAFPCMLLPSPL